MSSKGGTGRGLSALAEPSLCWFADYVSRQREEDTMSELDDLLGR